MWVGIDGEGIGRAPHRYVLLCTSDSAGRNHVLEDVRGIPTDQGLGWLLDCFGRKGPERHLAGYYLSYDWTMLLADLPHRTLYRLLRPELRSRPRGEGGFSPVLWRGYRLHWLSGMMRIVKGERSVTIWDVGKYYQQRFVGALETAGIAPPAIIERMKAERGTWDDSDLDRMRDYCLEECRLLARLCELLQEQHEAIGLRPRSWHGPGSTASTVLRQNNVLACHAKPLQSAVDVAAACAYFGGRFEQSRIGSRGVRSYDIRSAYPHAASTLPCLAHGKWVHRRRAPTPDAVALVRYRVSSIGDVPWGPLPCRLLDGSIVWPRGGSKGWVWNVEFQEALAWRGVDYGGEHWELVKRCDCEPFRFIGALYAARLSKPENKQVLKLTMNSVYGKLAQSTGGGSKWSSRVWAGLITATTRARLLSLIAMHRDPSELCALATDGAYSSEELDVPESTALGDWELGEPKYMTFVRPGVYWSHADILAWYGKPADRNVTEAARKAVRSRGISRAHLLTQVALAEAAIAHGETRATLGTTTQFGGARECVYKTPGGQFRRSRLYGQWYDMPATLSLRPEPKRDAEWRPPLLPGIESAPYVRGLSADSKMMRLLGSILEGRIR